MLHTLSYFFEVKQMEENKYVIINQALTRVGSWDFLDKADRDNYDKLSQAKYIDDIIDMDFTAAIKSLKQTLLHTGRNFSPLLSKLTKKFPELKASSESESDYI